MPALSHLHGVLVSAEREALLYRTQVHFAHFVMVPVRTVATDVKAKCKCGESVLGCEFMFWDASLCFGMRVYVLG